MCNSLSKRNFLIFSLISKYLTNILPITNLYTVLGAGSSASHEPQSYWWSMKIKSLGICETEWHVVGDHLYLHFPLPPKITEARLSPGPFWVREICVPSPSYFEYNTKIGKITPRLKTGAWMCGAACPIPQPTVIGSFHDFMLSIIVIIIVIVIITITWLS